MLFWVRLQVLEWFVAQWPLVVAGAIAVTGVSAWVERLKRVQELELKVKQLQRQEFDQDSRVVIPTPSEIKRYGRTTSSQFRRALRKPELLLGVLAILGPVVAAIYQQYRVNDKVKALDVQVAKAQQQISVIDARLNDANRRLGQATAEFEAEVAGTGGTTRPGDGPVAKAKLAHRNEIAAEVDYLTEEKTGAEARRRVIEEERRQLHTLP